LSVLLVLFSYLLGSVSFSYFLSKKIKGVDIRKVGSGNAGATNISRVLGLKFALLVLFLDALKGFVVALLASYLTPDTPLFLLCCSAVIIGHNWPVFFGFKGRERRSDDTGRFPGNCADTYTASSFFLNNYYCLDTLCFSWFHNWGHSCSCCSAAFALSASLFYFWHGSMPAAFMEACSQYQEASTGERIQTG